MKIAVIGAGITGLVVTCYLQNTEHEVHLYERNKISSHSGAGLTLMGNGVTALRALEMEDVLHGICESPVGMVPYGIRNSQGKWLSHFSAKTAKNTYVVKREALHENLHRRLLREPFYDKPIQAVLGQRLYFSRREISEPYDLIIGADGIHSITRRSLRKKDSLSYSGYRAWRGISNSPGELTGVGELWGRGARFGIMPLPNHQYYWFATQNIPEVEARDENLTALYDKFGDWHPDVLKIISASSPDSITSLPIQEISKPLKNFAEGSTVLVGDAAHAMTPNLGQGANQGLEDVAQLCLLINELKDAHSLHEELRTLLRRYDALRRPRTQRVANQSRLMGRLGQIEDPKAIVARDTFLKYLPDTVTEKSASSLISWTPENGS